MAEAVGDRSDIVFLDYFLSPLEMDSFFQHLHCYVSLHRAEGLGLTIASAMAAGVPAIATGWSGNVEFMTDDNSVLLPWSISQVGPNADPYPAEALWADPDSHMASEEMRRMFDNPDQVCELGERGRVSMERFYDPTRRSSGSKRVRRPLSGKDSRMTYSAGRLLSYAENHEDVVLARAVSKNARPGSGSM